MVGSSTFSVTVKGCGGHISSRRYTVSIAPAQTAHSVSLKWQSSPTAVSYDLYRSTFSGGPYGLVASAILGTIVRLQAIGMLTLEPERLKNQLTTTRKRSPEMEGLFTGDAQAACDFSFSASKFSPFFHRVSVMAAILRASVRRTIVGLMPLASDLW